VSRLADRLDSADSLAPQEYWDEAYAGLDLHYRPERVPFGELFALYLPSSGTCFEVGCYPGDFLIYLGQQFGYRVSGIDRTPLTELALPDHCRRHGVSVGELSCGDFFSVPIADRYDVVASFGFVEHFDDVEAVIERQADLVADGGTIVISAPNFRRGQYVLHRLLDADNLRRHSLPAMDLERWARVLRSRGFEILFAGYAVTADFWIDHPNPSKLRFLAARGVQRLAGAVTRLVDFPNPVFSPYMICFARKPAATR
jgi:SAM-dependent methyltransferase